jgi:hypothetical protein
MSALAVDQHYRQPVSFRFTRRLRIGVMLIMLCLIGTYISGHTAMTNYALVIDTTDLAGERLADNYMLLNEVRLTELAVRNVNGVPPLATSQENVLSIATSFNRLNNRTFPRIWSLLCVCMCCADEAFHPQSFLCPLTRKSNGRF